MQKIVRVGRDLIEKGEDFVLAEVLETVGSTPRKRGAYMIMDKEQNFYGTVGGGKLEAEVQARCPLVMEDKKTQDFDFSLTPADQQGIDMQCGGDAKVRIAYIDAHNTPDFGQEWLSFNKVYIFGGGHVGLEVEKMLAYIGFKTTVIDDRKEFVNRQRFPKAGDVKLVKDFSSAFDGLDCDENTYLVIVTRGHSWDYEVLKRALQEKVAYIGMIGSKRKNKTIFDRLREEGVTEDMLKQVHAPIGLSIGAETPEEIAVSIAAEIIQVKAANEN
ncbi:XdhC/CoxI family protein [Eubacteriaceae bacterium ES3]|nr:XdhC/CoxI family protein [Eubacteriaceae bacterium ES3]